MPGEIESVVSTGDDVDGEGDAADDPAPEALHCEPGGRQGRGRSRDEEAADREELQHSCGRKRVK